MTVRPETEKDIQAIFHVTRAAFEVHPVSNHTEQFIVNALRAADELVLSLVAEVDEKVVGHIAFSPVGITDGAEGWYGIGPLSVHPNFQRQGIGKALMVEGLAKMKASGARGFILVGDPAYYERFGFRSLPELTYEGVPQQYVLALPTGEKGARGAVLFSEGFSATS